MTEVEFLRRELERQLKAVDDLNKMVKDLSQITFESKMDKWLKASKGKEWVGLTDEDIFGIFGTYRGDPDYNHDQLLLDARRIESKIKGLNT